MSKDSRLRGTGVTATHAYQEETAMQGTWKQPLPYEHHDRCAEALEIKQVRLSRSIV